MISYDVISCDRLGSKHQLFFNVLAHQEKPKRILFFNVHWWRLVAALWHSMKPQSVSHAHKAKKKKTHKKKEEEEEDEEERCKTKRKQSWSIKKSEQDEREKTEEMCLTFIFEGQKHFLCFKNECLTHKNVSIRVDPHFSLHQSSARAFRGNARRF